MLCKHCGGENRPGDRFCRTCGGLLESSETLATLCEVPLEVPQEVVADAPPSVDSSTVPSEDPIFFPDAPLDVSGTPPAAPPPPAEAARVLTLDPCTAQPPPPPEAPPEAPPSPPESPYVPPAAPVPPEDFSDPLVSEEFPESPEVLPAEPTGRRVATVLASLGLSVLLMLGLTMAALSLSLLLTGSGEALLTLADALPTPLPLLQLLVAASHTTAAGGLLLLCLALLLWLFRTGGRPAVALRWLGGSAALSGVGLVLFGLLLERLPLPEAVIGALMAEGTLRSRCFFIGFILIVAGLLCLIATLAVRRRGLPHRGPVYRGTLQFFATLALVAATVAVTVSLSSAQYHAVPADAGPKYAPPTEAESALDAGNYEEALSLIGPDAAKGIGPIEDCLLAARAQRLLGDRESAHATLRAALSTSPNDAALCAELADLLLELADEAAALAQSDRASAQAAAELYREVLLYAPDRSSATLALSALDALWTVPTAVEPIYRWLGMGDLTWSEAMDRASADGTYAVLSGKGEFDSVTEMADEMGLTLVWLPAKLEDPALKTSAKWLNGESVAHLPYYSRQLPGQTGEETTLALLKLEDGWYLAALPEDPADFAQPGTIGWLCEK